MFEICRLELSKLSATQNDFIFVGLDSKKQHEAWRKLLNGQNPSEIAKRICHRRNGIGADGLLILEPDTKTDWTWDFYNRDGSAADMCGNAARCAGLWAAKKANLWRSFSFRTKAGEVTATRTEKEILVSMPKAKVLPAVSSTTAKFLRVHSGVPHAVLEIPERISRRELFSIGKQTRQHADFAPEGTNVTFVRYLKKNSLQAITYERGVENFTKACGTGAVAAAMWLREQKNIQAADVHLPGGTVHVDLNGPVPLLRGEAHWVADLQLYLNEWGLP